MKRVLRSKSGISSSFFLFSIFIVPLYNDLFAKVCKAFYPSKVSWNYSLLHFFVRRKASYLTSKGLFGWFLCEVNPSLLSLQKKYIKIQFKTNAPILASFLLVSTVFYMLQWGCKSANFRKSIAFVNGIHYSRTLYKIGINFSPETRNIDKWVVE